MFIDNTAVVSVLKMMETFHNFHLNCICKRIWEWCKDRSIWFLPVNGKKKLAEWMLETQPFNRVLQTQNFSPTTDLFASRLNHQLPTYVSYKPDRNAYAIDAFSFVRKDLKFHCLPAKDEE